VARASWGGVGGAARGGGGRMEGFGPSRRPSAERRGAAHAPPPDSVPAGPSGVSAGAGARVDPAREWGDV